MIPIGYESLYRLDGSCTIHPSKNLKEMLLYLYIILTLILGVIIGLNLEMVTSILGVLKINPKTSTKQHNVQEYRSDVKLEKQDMKHCFDISEVSFLNKLLEQDGNEVDVKIVNSIINLTNLSSENQRKRRHLFLKELNLKLFLIFGIRESIVRLDSQEDKRVKKYVLSEEIDRQKLMVSISVQVA